MITEVFAGKNYKAIRYGYYTHVKVTDIVTIKDFKTMEWVMGVVTQDLRNSFKSAIPLSEFLVEINDPLL